MKFGVNSLEEFDQLITDKPDEESNLLEDFQKVDYLTYRIKQITKMIEELWCQRRFRNLGKLVVIQQCNVFWLKKSVITSSVFRGRGRPLEHTHVLKQASAPAVGITEKLNQKP